jgi:hypothetical protein
MAAKKIPSPTDQLFDAIRTHPFQSPEEKLLATVKILIAQGADVDAQRPNKYSSEGPWHTPLTLAICSSLQQCALLLIPHATLGLRRKLGQGSDELLCAASRPLVLAALLDAGMDPRRQDDLGRTALMYALRFESARPPNAGPLLELRPCAGLLLPVSDALAVDHEGLTLSDWACKNYVGAELHFVLGAIDARAQAQALQACSQEGGLGRASSRL